MSSKTKRPQIDGAFVSHPLEMRESAAWRALPDHARRVLDRLEVEHMRHGGCENGRLICTYADLAAAGVRRASIALALRQCVLLGFLEVTRQGYKSPKDLRVTSLYRLTYVLNKRQVGKATPLTPTHDWRRIASDEQAIAALAVAQTMGRPLQWGNSALAPEEGVGPSGG